MQPQNGQLVMLQRTLKLLIGLALLVQIGAQAGCTTLVSYTMQGLTDDLSSAILDSDDIELVRDGAPAYLILIDGLVSGSPEDAALLQTAASLNSAYASAFIEAPERADRMHSKALELSLRAVCLAIKDGCGIETRPFADYELWLAGRREKDVPLLYSLGSSWAGWMQANSDDFNAIAQLSRVKALMQRVAELDPAYDSGGVHLYLGVFETLFPPAMGGRPEVGRGHFEQAVALSEGRHLLTKVMFAESYARLVFDRDLHDQLLAEVLDAPVREPGLTLMNTVAKSRARTLLEGADEYF